MTLNLIPVVHTKEEKKAANLRYKLNYIKRHFGGDEKMHKAYVAEKVRALYHDPTKDYKKVTDERRAKLYYERKEERESLSEKNIIS